MLCKKFLRGKSLMKFLMDLIFERFFVKNAEGTRAMWNKWDFS